MKRSKGMKYSQWPIILEGYREIGRCTGLGQTKVYAAVNHPEWPGKMLERTPVIDKLALRQFMGVRILLGKKEQA